MFILQNKLIILCIILLLSISLNIFQYLKNKRKIHNVKNIKFEEFNDNYKYSIELFKELYKEELEFKDKINAKISIPTGFLLLLFGAVYYYISNFKYLTIKPWCYIFYLLFSLFSISLVIAVFFTFRAYCNYKYQVLQTPLVLNRYIEELIKEFNSNHNDCHLDENRDKYVNQRLNHYLNYCYMRNTEINAWLNSKKLSCLKYISLFLIIAAIIGTLSLIPYQMSYLEIETIQQVKITK